jgi:hypothetical protein
MLQGPPQKKTPGRSQTHTLKAALQVLVEIRHRLWEDAKMRFNMSKVKIYIPGVSREHARELILQHIDSDPPLASLRELYDGMPLCAQRLMTSSRTCKSFASYRIPKSTKICFAFASTHALHSSPAMCLLT